jgi:hypothetical protein
MNNLIVAAKVYGYIRTAMEKEKEETGKSFSQIIRIALRKYYNERN